MELSLFFAIVSGLWFWFAASLAGYSWIQTLKSPLVIGTVLGLLTGNLETGLVAGGSIEMVYLGMVAAGGNIPSDRSEQTTASVLWGVLVGMEEQKALGADVDDEMIRTVKSSLMGPLAGIGDSLIQATALPLLTTIAISLAGTGPYSPLGPALFMVVTPILLWIYARFLFDKGYELGKEAVSMLMGQAMEKIKVAVQLFGIIVIGALSASYVKLTTPLQFAASADADPVVIQEIIDGVFPNLLGLLLVIGCWWLLAKKGMSVTKAIFGLMAVVVALGLIGIL